MRLLRQITAVLSIALMLLTAQTAAMARGQAPAVGEAVICLGGQAVSVAIDAEGKPTGPRHFCPDCVIHFAALDHSPVLAVAPMRLAGRIATLALAQSAAFAQPAELRARGPPVSV